MFLSKHRLNIASLRIGKHRIDKNIVSLRKVNIAHPYVLVAVDIKLLDIMINRMLDKMLEVAEEEAEKTSVMGRP